MQGALANTNNTVGANMAVPFTTITRSPPSSSISLDTTGTGIITLATTGNYQITFGVMPVASTATATASFILTLSTDGVTSVEQQTLEYQSSANSQIMYNLTTIVKASVNPTTMTLVNKSGATQTLNNVSKTLLGGPAAYMTIIVLE